jgi:ribulose-phosphate 3-epimerase
VTVRIAASILAADFAKLGEEVARAEAAGADLIHIDVMDGHFVPNLTLGPAIVEAVKRHTRLPLDVHLMIEEPDRYLDAFVGAGASMISVHPEVLPHLHRTLGRLRELGVEAGAAINPSTPVGVLADVAGQLDYILVMSVNPGFTGQTFIAHSIDKVKAARALLAAAGSTAAIEVDGGVDQTNAAALVDAGASILVAGAAIFRAPDLVRATRELRQSAQAAR